MLLACNNDNKLPDKLSKTMLHYLKEHDWEGADQHDTNEEEMLKRAYELYIHAVWLGEHISFKRCTFQQAVDSSKRNYL